MAPHYQSVTGRRFVAVLEKDGWAIDWQRNHRAQLSKPGYQPICITTAQVIPSKRVKALCQHATISASRFDELFLASAPPDLFTADSQSPSRFKH